MSDLTRFVAAQDRRVGAMSVYDCAKAELLAGRKETHWMWFMFPQIAGLGRSDMARYYALVDLSEAAAYLRHPVLGARVREMTEIVNATRESLVPTDVVTIFGSPDDLKFHASMTLFEAASGGGDPYRAALDAFFDGQPHAATVERLAA